MDLFTRDDLRSLIGREGDLCASIYMPTHRTGREIREDALRCKNLIREAEERLHEAGLRRPTARDMLEGARRLHDDEEFWKRQSDGLAIFAGPAMFRSFRVPVPFEELAVAAPRFEVTPILPMLEGDGEFYILAASQKQLRLLRGTHYSVAELHPATLPESLQEALNIDTYIEALTEHGHTTMGIGGGGSSEMIFHGQGDADLDVRKQTELREYFERVNDGLGDFFGEETAPLVFAGVQYLFPIFRDVCDYAILVGEPLTGNPDHLKPRELHERAWTVVSPLFERDRRNALERYHNQPGEGRVSERLESIVPAARQGAVETLLLARGERVWGQVDSAGNVARGERSDPENRDLLNDAAVHTILHRGTVYTLDREAIPGRSEAAALFRYPVPAESLGGEGSPSTGG